MRPLSSVASLALALLALLAVGCTGGAARLPVWTFEAKAAVDRAAVAYLEGNTRVEAAEMARARSEIGRSGRPDLLANAELAQCATRVASLVFEPCAGFERLRADSTPAQRAYAGHLLGQATAEEVPLLPEAQRGVASGSTVPEAGADALSQLVAAGVLMRGNRANPATVGLAVEVASSQGWRRPLLAWLGVQRQLALDAGDTGEAARIERRIAVAAGGPARPAAQP